MAQQQPTSPTNPKPAEEPMVPRRLSQALGHNLQEAYRLFRQYVALRNEIFLLRTKVDLIDINLEGEFNANIAKRAEYARKTIQRRNEIKQLQEKFDKNHEEAKKLDDALMKYPH